MKRNKGLVGLLAVALITSSVEAPAQAWDAEVAKGMALVDDGEYDAAILLLDGTARRLATDPKKTKDLSQAYLYLGIAYMGKGLEAAARAKFKEALKQIKDITLNPDKFPPKVINAFEAAKAETETAGPTASAAASPAPSSPEKKKGGNKALLLVGGIALVGGGVAVAAGGGGGGASPTTTTMPSETRNRLDFSGTLPNAAGAGYECYRAVATKPGTLEVRATWTNGQLRLETWCQEADPPYTNCAGTYNQTSNTGGVFTSAVTQKSYLACVQNYSSMRDTYMLTILFP